MRFPDLSARLSASARNLRLSGASPEDLRGIGALGVAGTLTIPGARPGDSSARTARIAILLNEHGRRTGLDATNRNWPEGAIQVIRNVVIHWE